MTFDINETGMAKEVTGKLDMKFCPPEWPVYLADHMQKGNEKGYDYENWAKPGSILELAIPIFRHLLDYLAGNESDPKDGSDILTAIACGALMLRSKRDSNCLTDDRQSSRANRPSPNLISNMIYNRVSKKKEKEKV